MPNKPNRSARRAALALAALLPTSLAACADDGPGAVPDPPELAERELPVTGGIEEQDTMELEAPDYEIGNVTVDANFECCEVTFALPRAGDEDSVTLMGSEAPLDSEDGIELERDGDTWSTTVCMPPGYSGHYYYVAALPADDPDVSEQFLDVRHNENVPTLEDTLLDTVNEFEPAATCDDLDADVHSDTSS